MDSAAIDTSERTMETTFPDSVCRGTCGIRGHILAMLTVEGAFARTAGQYPQRWKP
jgi:hypothetical protein